MVPARALSVFAPLKLAAPPLWLAVLSLERAAKEVGQSGRAVEDAEIDRCRRTLEDGAEVEGGGIVAGGSERAGAGKLLDGGLRKIVDLGMGTRVRRKNQSGVEHDA